MRLLLFLLLALGPASAFAQAYDASTAPNVYATAANPLYWKQRPPQPGYWQQDVHYRIKATLDDEQDKISSSFYELSYTNNSPDTLRVLYFHLYQNAFTPGSHYHNLYLENNKKPSFGKNRQEGKGIEVQNVRVNGQPVQPVQDNTILQVPLPRPLLPGQQLTVNLDFSSYWGQGSMRSRMKQFNAFGYKHYDGVHWYPRLAVYDRRFRWETEQHLDKEYYGNFGQFDVELTLPQEYVLEATGLLQNPQEAFPGDLRQRLDLKNFATKPLNSKPSVITPREPGKTKTWKFQALNVHDFAWTADPTYRLGEAEWNGVKCVAIVQEPHAAGWQPSAAFTADIIRVLSEDFGQYAYPKMVVADAQDGMEYPMLTLDGGLWPDHRDLLMHEVGHNWFFGMLGSNETYRAFLDEGFTQFLTVWGMDKLAGPEQALTHPNHYVRHFLKPQNNRYSDLYYPYLNSVWDGRDKTLNTHSSDFGGAIGQGGNYGLVYFKTGVMLYNLRYVLGEELFLKAMQHYVRKWKIASPYPEDFREAITEYTKTDLNWFFDQWLETTKTIDYSISEVNRLDKTGTYELTFRRLGEMQMPIDFRVTLEDGQQLSYHIPNTWFVKPTTATVLPRWYGFGLLHPTYKVQLNVPGKIKAVEIDPQHFLADTDLRNNRTSHVNHWSFDHRVPLMPRWDGSTNFLRPDVWYNKPDGLKVGLHAEGNYLNKADFYSFTGWYNTRNYHGSGPDKSPDRINQRFGLMASYRTPLHRLWPGLSVEARALNDAGVQVGQLGLEKEFRKQDQYNPEYSTLSVSLKTVRQDEDPLRLAYRLYPELWQPDTRNTTLNFGYSHVYPYPKGTGKLSLLARTSAFGSDYAYSLFHFTARNELRLAKLELRTRVFGQYGRDNVPLQSALYLASNNPEQRLDNKFTRASGFVPDEWLGYGPDVNHFQQGGGLNLRGYAGYLATQQYNDQDSSSIVTPAFVGRSGAAVNAELDFDRYLRFNPFNLARYFQIDTYLFADAGLLQLNKRLSGDAFWGKLRADAGLGSALTIKFGPLRINPLTVRFDMPLFLSATPAVSPEHFQFRYVVGINRAF